MSAHDESKAALLELCRLNLIEFARESARWSGGCVVESAGILTYSVRAARAPLLAGVHRVDPRANAEEVVRRGLALSRSTGRAWSIWARAADPAERDLISAASAAGLKAWPHVPAMVLLTPSDPQLELQDVSVRPADPQLELQDVSIRPASTAQDIEDFWQVNQSAFRDSGYADELPALFGDAQLMLAPHIGVAVARDREARPVGAALALLSHGVAGVYWVGTVPSARRAGIGSACTASVVRSAFASGARAIFLHASSSGYGVYRDLGFEDLTQYVIMGYPADADPAARARDIH
jgi:ribosomal protein S18 acetylase RimI-like enzyme